MNLILASKSQYLYFQFLATTSAKSMVMGGNMVKVVAWYDNEWGYSQRVVDLAEVVFFIKF